MMKLSMRIATTMVVIVSDGNLVRPVVCMAWSGRDAISVARNLIGPTNGREAAPGTIRGDFGMDIGYNMIHGSDAPETAEFELGLWFPEGTNEWTQDSQSWVYE